jgi:hypothetical protein
LFSAGCQPPQTDSVANAVAARGTLLQNGEPLAVAGREIGTGMVQITFLPVDAATAGQTFATAVDEQGNFDLPGGMPAGKYRVAVRQWEPYPGTDKLGGRFDEQRTTLMVEVDGKTPLKVELP